MCPRRVFFCVCLVSFSFGACSQCTPQCLCPQCVWDSVCPHSGDLPPCPACVFVYIWVSGRGCSGAGGRRKLCPWSGVPGGAPQPDLLPCSRDLCLTSPPHRIFPRDLPGLHELIGTRFFATRDMLGNSYLWRHGGGRLPGFLPLGLVLFHAHGDWFLSWAFRPICASEALPVSRERQTETHTHTDFGRM